MPLQATSGAASYDAFGGGAAAVPQYIEDVFSTYLYTGNGSTQTITNGIDLAGKGGLVWFKARTIEDNSFQDTARKGDFAFSISSNKTTGQSPADITAFNSNGFSLRNHTGAANESAINYCSWTFRKQPKFFDVVTYTGNDAANRQISHSLGSTPGCIIVKKTNESGAWYVYHRSLGNWQTNTPYTLYLNTTDSQTPTSAFKGDAPTSTTFTVDGVSGAINETGRTYVAYLFAHNAGGFGLTGTDNVISCGSYTGNYSSGVNQNINLGWEPQFVLIKNASDASADTIKCSWQMYDQMRGFNASGTGKQIRANSSDAEIDAGTISVNSQGFNVASPNTNDQDDTYIYIAIRRGPMKVPTSGTSVFDIDLAGNASAPSMTSAFPVDLGFIARRSGGDSWYWVDRLRGGFSLTSDTTAAEASFPTLGKFDYMNGYGSSTTLTNYTGWNFRRAPSFMDVVCYTGTGSARTIAHNLTVAPELMIVKCRSTARAWPVYAAPLGNTEEPRLNESSASGSSTSWNSTTPTSSVFSVSNGSIVNASGDTYVAYLFATCAGVSKVGSYTGNGSTQTIDCGFGAGGARFVLIKRTDSTSGWYVYDTSRGMTTLTDPYMFLNNQDAEAATLGSVTTVSTGFALNSTILAAINVSGGTYIFLAIA